MNEIQIETILRQAPVPVAGHELRGDLLAEIQLPRNYPDRSATTTSLTPLWRRWVPALSFGLLFLGCLMVLGVQTLQVLDLRRQNEALTSAASALEDLRRENAELKRLRIAAQEDERLRRDVEELQKLRAEVADLRARAQDSAALEAEHQRLQAEHSAAMAGVAVPPDNDPFAKAKQKAQSTACINNLKQIGLAARIWANEHKTSVMPVDWLQMKDELNTPKILTCPADTNRIRAASWEQFDGSSVSYELPSATPDERDPHIVYSRCRIHGHIGYTDGSAHQGVKSDWLEMIDGNLRNRGTAPIGK